MGNRKDAEPVTRAIFSDSCDNSFTYIRQPIHLTFATMRSSNGKPGLSFAVGCVFAIGTFPFCRIFRNAVVAGILRQEPQSSWANFLAVLLAICIGIASLAQRFCL
ncbi:MAG: hypothetical protein DMG62_01225 [Acidobacteria bacterium]|nr:MAG: hypothetical protein DMG62_01225 [Acidobacteriota bacterium]